MAKETPDRIGNAHSQNHRQNFLFISERCTSVTKIRGFHKLAWKNIQKELLFQTAEATSNYVRFDGFLHMFLYVLIYVCVDI